MEEFFKDIKIYGYINHISSFLLILFFILTIFFSVIVGVVKYSLTYIENNPEKYLPTQK